MWCGVSTRPSTRTRMDLVFLCFHHRSHEADSYEAGNALQSAPCSEQVCELSLQFLAKQMLLHPTFDNTSTFCGCEAYNLLCLPSSLVFALLATSSIFLMTSLSSIVQPLLLCLLSKFVFSLHHFCALGCNIVLCATESDATTLTQPVFALTLIFACVAHDPHAQILEVKAFPVRFCRESPLKGF